MNPEDEKVRARGKQAERELREKLEQQQPVTNVRVGEAAREGLGDRELQQYETEHAEREQGAEEAGAPDESSAEKLGKPDVTPIPGYGTSGSAPPD